MNKLIANQKAYETLAAYLRGGRLSHAILIEGPAGCGKTTFALEIAQAALCRADAALRPCGECRDCLKAEKNIHPDILTYSGEGGSRSFHISTVREVRQQAHVRPNEAEGKVMILRNTQDMSAQAQNALLKVIEEPPAGVTFLLTCTSRAAMLETVLSRVQVIPLELPGVDACAERLAALLPETDADAVRQAAAKYGGNIGQALTSLEADEQRADRAAGLLYDVCIGDELAALAELAKYERDRNGFTALLERMYGLLSDALLRPSADEGLAKLAKRAGRLRGMQILAIIEDTAHAAAGNVGGLLLTTSLCSRVRSVLAD